LEQIRAYQNKISAQIVSYELNFENENNDKKISSPKKQVLQKKRPLKCPILIKHQKNVGENEKK
jgi:hypothetical protein